MSIVQNMNVHIVLFFVVYSSATISMFSRFLMLRNNKTMRKNNLQIIYRYTLLPVSTLSLVLPVHISAVVTLVSYSRNLISPDKTCKREN